MDVGMDKDSTVISLDSNSLDILTGIAWLLNFTKCLLGIEEM